MGKVVVVAFITLDGVVEDPDGSGGTASGGWAFHAGPDVFAGDKFGVSDLMADGVLLLGRRTWELFAERWPGRTGEFPDLMNRTPKVVVSHAPPPLDAWSASSVLEGDLVDGVAAIAATQHVVVVGSTDVVHQLAAADAVDEYRLITIPISVGAGTRLFAAPTSLRLVAVEPRPATVLATYERAPATTA